MPSLPIYVEIRIRGAMDELWRLTQTPHLHEQWDLRFSQIEYLARPDPAQPQRFLYATRIGLGMRIAGEGESVGENNGPAGRVSALKFWSDDPKSLIREGSGYWKYVPSEGGIQFLTRYDYRTRFGAPGRIIDRLLFRPVLGWATAWSFDRLRLWIERGIDPAASMQRSMIHAVARIAVALIWIYQGLVPKLLFMEQSGEIDTMRGFGLSTGHERAWLAVAGTIEFAFGLMFLIWWRARRLFLVNAVVMILLGIAAAVSTPNLFVEQFNPFTLNLAMVALSIVGWVAAKDLPTARNCLRREIKPNP
ncbi:MAG: DoxX-like family protein [Phycisphaerales bacterium]|nr:DoxX-like family protein [Phycisphaerales bacterium]MCI0629944.1 DoxX-like family protein [Phycisphaerales bacterium]MCI0675747.1 DoxX-like family protein [Phycisphaerales bacterium]